jgi:hypothetical protein
MHFALKAATLIACCLSLTPWPVAAQSFEKQEVDNLAVVAIAAPYGDRAHQLRIIQQVSRTQSCWREVGANPVEIDLLLNQFDYTDICNVGTDSNGFSIRMADQDLGLIYSLRIVNRATDLVLIGAPPLGVKAPEIEIGRANGYTSGFAKIQLNPGWRFTRRAFNGMGLGHIYLTSDQPLSTGMATPANPPEKSAELEPPTAPPHVGPSMAMPAPIPPAPKPQPNRLPDAAIPIFVPPPMQNPEPSPPQAPPAISPQMPGLPPPPPLF